MLNTTISIFIVEMRKLRHSQLGGWSKVTYEVLAYQFPGVTYDTKAITVVCGAKGIVFLKLELGITDLID